MRIGVTIRTSRKGKPSIARFVVRPGRMTFLARDLGMGASQRIARFRMIELFNLDLLPVVKIVALQTIAPQSSFVFVLVTRDTGLRDAQEGLVQIFDLNGYSLRGGYLVGGVTLVAGQTSVLALEFVPRLLVVEGFGIPFDDGKILAIMLGMTAHALLA